MKSYLKNSFAIVLGDNSAKQKNSSKMSDNCLGGARAAQQQPPWRPREEPKLPLFPLCAKAFACPPLPCRFPRSWMASVVHLGSPKRNKHTNERAIPQKGLFSPRLPPPPRPLLSRWLWTVSSNPLSFITSPSVHFHFQAACYPLNLDITSTQTPSLCLS